MKETMIHQLRALGIEKGDTVLVHSSMKQIGTAMPPEAIIDILQDAIGADGTLLFPALTYATVTAEQPVFDGATAEPCIGLLPRTFFRMPGVYRSAHPTHSVCARGRRAKELTSGHELDETPVGANSPFMRLPAIGGKLLFIGGILHACTFMHGVEEIAGADYALSRERTRYIVNGQERWLFTHDFAGWNQEYPRIRSVLGEDELRKGHFGNANAYVVDCAALLQKGAAAIRRDNHYFVSEDNAQ